MTFPFHPEVVTLPEIDDADTSYPAKACTMIDHAVRPTGLTAQEAADRRARGQGNTLPPATNRTYIQIVRDNVFNFINVAIFLLGAALVAVGRPLDALLSVGIIFVNIIVSLVQEVRAKRILDRVALLTRPKATVVRGNVDQEVAPDEVVVGDILRLGLGDQIIVDGVLRFGALAIDESQLTGESDLIAKKPGDPLYSGSFCVSGGGYYEATAVGEQSMANKMTISARAYRRVLTPLQTQINLAVRLILFVVLYLQVLLVANSVINAVPLPEGVERATVIVSLVPNGLFLSIAIAYALAAVRIVSFGALIQQSNAVESLSNVDVLCLDKTGTLTTNQLHCDQVISLQGASVELEKVLGTLVASTTTGNKTSEAIAAAYNFPPQRIVAEVPFSSARKWSAVAFDDRLRGVYALGAPEFLRPYLADAAAEDAPIWQQIVAQSQGLIGQGLRVLLVAYHPDPTRLHDDGDASVLPDGMTALGLVSLSDELRAEAREVLASFAENGVRPKIISGDNPETVAALARQAGLDHGIKLYSGLDLEAMSDAAFEQAAVDGDIFGRITPEQKERLVDALRRRGHYVAMIGDGVNDVLSLKKANLGIAMHSGAQATRGVADIVLINDSFAALAPTVAEGQRIVNGMQDILKLFMTRIMTMMLLIISAWSIGVFPINVRQGSLVTLLTVGIPVILLAIWAQPGHRYHQTLVRRLLHFVLPASILASLIGLGVFYTPLVFQLTPDVQALGAEDFLRVFADIIRRNQSGLSAYLILVGLLLLPFVEPPTAWWVGADRLSGDWRPTWLALGLGVLFLVIVATPMRDFFDLAPLDLSHSVLIVLAALLWLFLVRVTWRRRLLERFFGVDLTPGA